MTADGSGLVALSYRGYGGSTGQPTEDGLITDAVPPMTTPPPAIHRPHRALG